MKKKSTVVLIILIVLATPIRSISQERITLRNGSKTMSYTYSQIRNFIMNGGSPAWNDQAKILEYELANKDKHWQKVVERYAEWPKISDTTYCCEEVYDTLYDPQCMIYLVPSTIIKVVMLDYSNGKTINIGVITENDMLWTCKTPLKEPQWWELVSKEFVNDIISYTLNKEIPYWSSVRDFL